MESPTALKPEAREKSQYRYMIRCAVAVIVLATVCSYIAGIVLGKISAERKLGGAEVLLVFVSGLVVTVLLRPELLERLTHVKIGSVEVELRKLQEDQQVQRNELDDLRFVLTLLLQHSEKEHLRKLNEGETQDYVGRPELRTELRKLRTLGLIRSCEGRRIHEIADKRKVDLKDFVKLTERGRHYLERIGEYTEDQASSISQP
jgi:hypothetical protein